MDVGAAVPWVIAPVVVLIVPLVLSSETLLALMAPPATTLPPFDSTYTLTEPVPVLVPVIAPTVTPEPVAVALMATFVLVLDAFVSVIAPVCEIAPVAVKLIVGGIEDVPVKAIVLGSVQVPVILATTLPTPLILPPTFTLLSS